MGRHASNKQGNGYKTDGNFLATHPFTPSSVSEYQVMGEGSKGGQTGLISGLPEGVLEDEWPPGTSGNIRISVVLPGPYLGGP